ncbi:MAG TPA: WXG100 family type VII secretion target, partial [Nonomuraea sp.]|nr:WXG100 family type VII secretion target [Nonomuraea sp.]
MSVVDALAALKKKVDGDPQAIRTIASGLRAMGGHVSDSANQLVRHVGEVGQAWQGASATAFADYMAAYPKAGRDLKGALDACATALDTAATALQSASTTVNGLLDAAIAAAYQCKLDNSGATASDIDRYVKERLGDPVGTAGTAVTTANNALTTAKNALDGQLGRDAFGFFKAIRQPGGADFQPG